VGHKAELHTAKAATMASHSSGGSDVNSFQELFTAQQVQSAVLCRPPIIAAMPWKMVNVLKRWLTNNVKQPGVDNSS